MEKKTGSIENKMMDAKAATEKGATTQVHTKRTNKTWEAFGRSRGCFIINDPKFAL